MKPRKIILIAADLILLVVCILQGIFSAKDNVRTFKFSETPDEIIIEKSDGNIRLVKEDEQWFINDEKYEATLANVDNMIEYSNYIRAIERVGKLTNEAVAAKYEFDEMNAIKVTVNAGGKTLRTYTLGKDCSTGVQCYATVDGSNDIYIIDHDYRFVFDKTVDQLRSKVVYTVDPVEISSVSVKPADGEQWAISRTGSADDLQWNVSGAEITLDTEKASDWFNGFATLTVSKWHGKSDDIGGEPYISVNIGTTGKSISIQTFIVPSDPEVEDSSPVYYGKCSSSPYYFEISSYNMANFQKTPEDLQR